MKKGVIIVLVVGVAILIAVFLLPVTPTVEKPLNTTTSADSVINTGALPNEASVDAQVQAAVESLADTTKPPMQAIMKLRQLAEDHPDNVSANFTLGMLSIRTVQYENALMRFDKVIAVAPENVDAYAMKAQVYMAMGNSDEAKVAMQKAIDLAEGDKKQQLLQQQKNLNINE